MTWKKGTIRGMHYQSPPFCEAKIIRCLKGKIFDVIVDLRAASPTFLRWHAVELSADNMLSAYIPEGFAHGFQTLSDSVELMYHHSVIYCSEHQRGLRFSDPVLGIHWPLPVTVISLKDQAFPLIDNTFQGIVP